MQSPAAGRSSAYRQDSAASLMFGAPPPVLDGAARGGQQPRAERRAPSPQPRASPAGGGPLRGLVPVAGAGANQQPRAREQQEMEGERRGRAKPVDLDRVWDDYEAHVEDNAFEKMRGTLGRLERRASREFELYRGAAGWSSEKLQERDDRRASSPHRRQFARGASSPRRRDSVQALIGGGGGGETERPGTSPGRSASPGRRRGEDTDRSPGSAREPPAAPRGSVPRINPPPRGASPRYASPTASSRRAASPGRR